MQSPWGILKSPLDKQCNNNNNSNNAENEPTAGKDHPVPPLASRVSFRLDNEAESEEHETETAADREVEAITGSERTSPGNDTEVRGTRFSFSTLDSATW